jgi:hypothetical protein
MRTILSLLCLVPAVWLIGQTGAVVTALASQGRAGQTPAHGSTLRDAPDDPKEPDDPKTPNDPPKPDDPDDPDDPDGPPSGGSPEPQEPVFVIRPGASLAWDQDVTPRVPLSRLSFRLYVDGEPATLAAVRCDAGPAGTNACSVPAPALPVGLHALTISSSDGSEESSRSNAILVRVEAPASTAAAAARLADRGLVAAAAPLEDPSDMLVISDELTLLSERAGRVRLLRSGQLEAEPALVLADVDTGHGHGLLALTAGADVARTGLVYLLYSTGPGLRVARAQLVDGRLSQLAVIVDGLPAAARRPEATMRVGPDAMLYVALGAGEQPGRAGDLGDWTGKVLRFTTDGATPRDQRAASPVVFAGLSAPTAMTWDRRSGTLWVADHTAGGRLVLHQLPAGADAGSVVTTELPLGAVGRAALVVPGPGDGSLLVSAVSAAGERLTVQRLEIPADGRLRSNREVVLGGASPILSLAVTADGFVLYQTPTGVGRAAIP